MSNLSQKIFKSKIFFIVLDLGSKEKIGENIELGFCSNSYSDPPVFVSCFLKLNATCLLGKSQINKLVLTFEDAIRKTFEF